MGLHRKPTPGTAQPAEPVTGATAGRPGVESGAQRGEPTTRASRPGGQGAEAPAGPAEAGTGAARRPADSGLRFWWGVLVRTARGFQKDHLTDWAAALTYYAALSIFPGLLLLVSILGMLGQSVTTPLVTNLGTIAPGPVRTILTGAVSGLHGSRGTAGILAVVGLLGALWAASGYMGAFMRAANTVFDVPEGRPVWKTVPIRLAITVAAGVLLAICAFIVVFTGRLAEALGRLLGVGDVAVTVWGIAKWPVLLILVACLFALLYWAAPNAKAGGFRPITPGGLLGVLLWVAASVGFAFYVANFGSYNKTYGSLGAVIVFLVWLWITNLAVLLGAEFDAELSRGRAMSTGMPEGTEPYLPLRDTRTLDADS